MSSLYAYVRVKIETDDKPPIGVAGKSLSFFDAMLKDICSQIAARGLTSSPTPNADLVVDLDGRASSGCIDYEGLFGFAAQTLAAHSIASGLLKDTALWESLANQAANKVHPENTKVSSEVRLFEHVDEQRFSHVQTSLAQQKSPTPETQKKVRQPTPTVLQTPVNWIVYAVAMAVLMLGWHFNTEKQNRMHADVISLMRNTAAPDNPNIIVHCSANDSFDFHGTNPEPALVRRSKLVETESVGTAKIVRISPE